MQNIIHTLHTYKITFHFFFLFLRIDSVNTALGPLGTVYPHICYNLYVSP